MGIKKELNNLTDSELPSGFLVAIYVEGEAQIEIGRKYMVYSSGTTIGNTPEADIYLSMSTMSPYCIKLSVWNGEWFVQDMINEPKVLVNQLLVQECQIYDGDIIHLGPAYFEFCSLSGIKASYFKRIESLLSKDFLTHAYNRSFLFHLLQLEVERVERQLKKQEEAPLPLMSILMVDADFFGKLNKTYGHTVGDEVLKELVSRIKSKLRSADIVARYGGEEFIILLFDTSTEQALEVAEKIRIQVSSSPFQIYEKHTIPVTISVGIASFKPGMSVMDFIDAADMKMRKAKESGKNRVEG